VVRFSVRAEPLWLCCSRKDPCVFLKLAVQKSLSEKVINQFPCFLPSEIAADRPVKDRPVLAANIHCGYRVLFTGDQTHFGALSGTHHSYLSDDRTRAAVKRSFEIIGEALNRSFKIGPEQIDSIRNNLQLILLRNILAHCRDAVGQKCWSLAFTELSSL